MKIHPLLLPILVGGTISLIYILPKVGAVAQSAVNMTLPTQSGGWTFDSQPPTEKEIEVLAADTEFSKANCFSARPGEFNSYGNPVPDVVYLSVVLSGSDINNSIHRPERCMPSQGHNITSSSDQVLKLANGRDVEAKRLVSIQAVRDMSQPDREVYQKYNSLTYYFFVGHDKVTNNHLGRTVIDIKDRLLRGMDQRWAYVSVSMWYGKVPWIPDQEVSEAEADKKIKAFLTDFSEKQINWDQIKP